MPEHAVLTAQLAGPSGHEGDLDRRDALQHLVRAHGVESGESREEGNGHVQFGHAVAPWTTRNRRR